MNDLKITLNKWEPLGKYFPPTGTTEGGHPDERPKTYDTYAYTRINYLFTEDYYIHPSGKTIRMKHDWSSFYKDSLLQESFGGAIIFARPETEYIVEDVKVSLINDYVIPDLDSNKVKPIEWNLSKQDQILTESLTNQCQQINEYIKSEKNISKYTDYSQTNDIESYIYKYFKEYENIDVDNMCLVIEPDRIKLTDTNGVYNEYGFDIIKNQNKLGASNLVMDVPDYNQRSNKNIIKPYQELSQLDNNLLDTSSIKVPEQKKHQELYESQEWALEQLQKQGSGFQMLAGEVGVGKTHIASAYINDYFKDNPNAKILIVEPVKEVIPKFEQLINNLDNVTITDDVKQLNQGQWDVVLFDEMHKQNNKTVKDFPRKTKHYPDVVIGMTGTVSDMKPYEVLQITKNYTFQNLLDNGSSMQQILSFGGYDKSGRPIASQYQQLPEAYVNNILKPVDLLRSDVKELNLESRMPVNKYQAGFDLSPKDKAFYNMMSKRAKALNMSKSNQIDILDKALNPNKSEIVIQPVKNFNTKKVQYELVDYADELDNTHDLLYLGKRDTSFRDKKVDFIKQTINHVDGKVLLYLTSDNHQEHLMKDLQAEGIDVEYVNTNEAGAVQKINDSKAKVVAFNVLPIREGVDLKANTVMWYNTPQTAGIDEQACGRITRLTSSAEEKNIYYLYNKTTVQEQMVNEIIQTNNVNNMALKRDNDNIQQL